MVKKEAVVDFIGLLGLSMLGYGLYLFLPGLSFSVIGSLLILFSVKAART